MKRTKLSLIDTHAHLDTGAFNQDRTDAITRSLDAGIGIITVGTSLESSRQAITLSEAYAGVYAAVGIHPHDVTSIGESDIAGLAEIARHPRVVAIGEIGLDFYRDYSPRDRQIDVLKQQLALATELELPVIIHCRQAEDDMLKLLDSWLANRPDISRTRVGVIHCFNGGSDTARTYLDMGFYLSLGAYIGYPNSKKMHNAIRSIPGDRLLVETDCPFLPPQSHRGQRNEPAYLPLTTKALAEIRGGSYEDYARTTTQNAQRLFNLDLGN